VIAHAGIEIRREDADACLHFWWLLGFERVAVPDALAERTLWVQAGPTQIHLLFSDDPVAPPEGHVAVVVDDFERTFSVLETAGMKPDERSRYWGSRRAFVRSPGGHRVEFMDFAPDS
jgi:catechol 2,3-dioxygenase-like lactoylglutathione lyase family enzyme